MNEPLAKGVESDGDDREDHELLQRWRDGDAVAGETLIRSYVQTLTRFFSPRAGHHAADLVQGTLLALMHLEDRALEIKNFKAYLLGIARKQFLMWARRRSIGARLDAEGKSEDRPKTKTTPSQHLSRRERVDLVREALDDLSLDHQLTVQLYYWEDLSVAEIAEIANVSVGTVKSRLGRARNRIALHLKHSGIEDLI